MATPIKLELDLDNFGPLIPIEARISPSRLIGRVFFYKQVPYIAYETTKGCSVIRLRDEAIVCSYHFPIYDLFFTRDIFGFKQDKNFLDDLKARLDDREARPHLTCRAFDVIFDREALERSSNGWKLEDALIFNKNLQIEESRKPPKEGDVVMKIREDSIVIGHVQIASIQRFGDKFLYSYSIYLSERYMRGSGSHFEYVLVDNTLDVRNWLKIQCMKEAHLSFERVL